MSAAAAGLFAGRDAPLFGRRQRRERGGRLPVVVVTGFLGSGKTTLIRALLATPQGADTAVVVNEYGEIGIDDALLRASSDATVLLGNGCLCCSVRSDLQETLRTLFIERAKGAVPSFVRVVIETSGLADPAPILQTFATDRALGREFHLQSLVAVVDAVAGPGNLGQMPEARKQVALADRLVVTKSDLAGPAASERFAGRLAALSAAPQCIALDGVVDPGFLLDDPVAPRPRDLGGHAHSHGIASFTLLFDEPLSWAAFEQAMGVLTVLRGRDLLRVKGIVALRECRGPVVVHYVQHLAHRPVELEAWPDPDHRSRLVFITRNLGREAVEGLFAAVRAVAGRHPPGWSC
jgi:G3E family GTPase